MTVKEYLAAEKAKKEARANDLKARLADIAKRACDIKDINKNSDDEKELKAANEELDKLLAEKAEKEAELEGLKAELDELDKQIAELDKPAEDPKPEEDPQPNPERKAFLNFGVNNTDPKQPQARGGQNIMTLEERQARAKALVDTNTIKIDKRAILVSSEKIATPTGVGGINDNMNRVSSLFDLVKKVNCEGMGANKIAYEISIGTAYDQTEGQPVEEGDPEYDYVTINPESVMALASLSKQVRRQSPLDYEGKVVDSVDKAVRVKLNAKITAAVKASALLGKPAILKIAAIDEKTLRNIALNYGGEDSIYGDAWLFLNQKDLVAFGEIYNDLTSRPVYDITPDTANPNTGIIKAGGLSVRYCLNKHCTALEDASENDVTMFYGQPENIELDLFSDVEVNVSEDFKFSSNMLTIRGDVEAGSAITKLNGIIAVTKAAD